MDILNHPRYKEKPVLLFFENFVLDAIGELPEENETVLNDLGLQAIFGTKAEEWRDVVRESLQLSPTISISILDNWVKALDADPDTEPKAFSHAYVDEYFRDGSQLDTWTEQGLQDAVNRIKDYIIKGIQETGEPLEEHLELEEAES
ncbi:MAG: hypothetical protein OEX00_04335 [Gammaproteobacteria bacterium]|nr:hypothetical protein [Gammaproteobacteria bacterium]MDH5691628.1 hypothetical protein [Gammaproteobacteria bacterium]